ncbi:hypothetical protein K435DRAFT_800198 [Dendrothele bispora CBS 962.96]|uniref:Uncharacterized protein n=1 Tax=Dendrothele bispora (strain CBS 962.96) TaxID=1314807 RepID=A0A4S8LTE7_DENBC|nr:hypothetical protein K435DRAFT_800198 [Dendrothele bispora CBS 962.96]
MVKNKCQTLLQKKLSERAKKGTLENDVNKKPTLFGCKVARIRGTGNACFSFDEILKIVWKRNPGIFSHKLDKSTSTIVYEQEERSWQGIKSKSLLAHPGVMLFSFSHHDHIKPLTPLLNVLQKHITSNSSTSHKAKIQMFHSLLARPSISRPIYPATYGAVLAVSFGAEAIRHGNILGKDNGKGCY